MDLDKEIITRRVNAEIKQTLDDKPPVIENFLDLKTVIDKESKRFYGKKPPKRVVSNGGKKEFGSTEATYPALMEFGRKEFIINLYRNVLLREPDQQGLESFLKLLNEGEISETEVFSRIALSDEALEKKVHVIGIENVKVDAGQLLKLDGIDFVEYCYLWCLGREVDVEGIRSIVGAIGRGIPKELILERIARSDEAKNRNVRLINFRKRLLMKKFKYRVGMIPIIGELCKKFYKRYKNR